MSHLLFRSPPDQDQTANQHEEIKSYRVYRADIDETGNWVGEENSDLYFTDGMVFGTL